MATSLSSSLDLGQYRPHSLPFSRRA